MFLVVKYKWRKKSETKDLDSMSIAFEKPSL